MSSLISQDLINAAIGLIAFFGGWILKAVWESLKELKEADKELADKVARIEVLVAGEYIKRGEFDKFGEALFRKLDKIEDKVDGKADKGM